MSAHMVHTVEELRALGPGSEIRFESPPGKEAILARRSGDWFVITGERGWYTEERLEHLLPATVLIEAIDPDEPELIERVAIAAANLTPASWAILASRTRALWLDVAHAALKEAAR